MKMLGKFKYVQILYIFLKFIVSLLHLVSYPMPAWAKTRHVSNCK